MVESPQCSKLPELWVVKRVIKIPKEGEMMMDYYAMIDGGQGGDTWLEADDDNEAIASAIEWAQDGDWPADDSYSRADLLVERRDFIDPSECARCYELPVAIDFRGRPACAEHALAYGPVPLITEMVEVYHGRITVAEPEEPECSAKEHDWCSPFELLGGCEENPGVMCHGGGIISKKCCSHCGIYQITDTWAQDHETGEEGLRETTYESADGASLAWIAGDEDEDEAVAEDQA